MPKKSQTAQLPPEFDRTALLVIDVQQGLFEKSNPIYLAEQLIDHINTLAEQARRCGVPVVYIQHCDARGLVKKSREWQLHRDLRPTKSDAIVYKEFGNAFKETNLGELLGEYQVGRVVVTGLVTHGCVKNTCLGARELGYAVVLVSDAHSNYNPDAPALIEKWHANLQEAGVTLQPAAQIQFE